MRETPPQKNNFVDFPLLFEVLPLTMRKIPFITILLVSTFSLLLGCSNEAPSGAASDRSSDSPSKETIIAVIPKGASHEFWKSVHAGALQASKELEVPIIWKAPVKENDRESQIKVVEDFVSRGVSGIVLSPADNRALRVPVREAVQSDIPVVIIDSELKSNDPASFVATDNAKGGELAAETLAGILGGEGRVLMLRYQEGQESTSKREVAFLKTMTENYPNIKVVSHNQYSGSTTETAYQASENLLNAHKDNDGNLEVDGIFASCEPVLFGMIRALEDNGLAGKVRLVGFDSSPKLVRALEEGTIDALVMQDPVQMGYLGVKNMVLMLRGEKIPTRIDTGVTVVTRENMGKPRYASLLTPDLSILEQVNLP